MSVVATTGRSLVVAIALVLLLAACGQKGPLIAARGAASAPAHGPAVDAPVPAVISSPAPP